MSRQNEIKYFRKKDEERIFNQSTTTKKSKQRKAV